MPILPDSLADASIDTQDNRSLIMSSLKKARDAMDELCQAPTFEPSLMTDDDELTRELGRVQNSTNELSQRLRPHMRRRDLPEFHSYTCTVRLASRELKSILDSVKIPLSDPPDFEAAARVIREAEPALEYVRGTLSTGWPGERSRTSTPHLYRSICSCKRKEQIDETTMRTTGEMMRGVLSMLEDTDLRSLRQQMGLSNESADTDSPVSA
ncbi:hypothetical protein BD324DRAFT_386487 [Kockovaella imperatae]|uniref:Uncharacterized protein n=1 Tax=Kockovaella imperatae TaxID=4999 RepID=A0A1Y1UJE1_9TREE|nr:hypothetical protein BD324DRAFT_386487 [Kockovaella imperatae]ORX37586.1 hypothetical protein BD324DRAFT_386487 [Kockovaella imperatae]